VSASVGGGIVEDDASVRKLCRLPICGEPAAPKVGDLRDGMCWYHREAGMEFDKKLREAMAIRPIVHDCWILGVSKDDER
jgi:hypothetical protein